MPILGIMASSFRSAAGPQGAYDALATVTLSTTATSITFVGIPTGYKHLQIRAVARTDYTGGAADGLKINFNSDTGNNYSWHQLQGSGASAFAQAASTTGTIYAAYLPSNTANSNVFGVTVIDILDYQNTNKNKTVRNLIGYDNNGSGYIGFGSGLWQSTTAITSITIDQWDGSNFLANSSFALYGIKG